MLHMKCRKILWHTLFARHVRVIDEDHKEGF
jgi:hypothetical protein